MAQQGVEKKFAEGYERDENGWILLPRDVEWRKRLFPQEVFEHPAKAQMFLIKELVAYLTEPGQSILDPFGGTGTLQIARLVGRNVVLIDIEDPYVQMMKDTQRKWEEEGVQAEAGHQMGRLLVYQGDNKQVLETLPFLVDAAIFSPPYSQALTPTGIREQTKVMEDGRVVSAGKSNIRSAFEQYQKNPLNMGNLNPFYFEHGMIRIYERLAKRVVQGGPMAIISKDLQKGSRREMLSEKIIRQATKAGWAFSEWFKWKPPGTMQKKFMKAKGATTIDDEDILVFRRR